MALPKGPRPDPGVNGSGQDRGRETPPSGCRSHARCSEAPPREGRRPRRVGARRHRRRGGQSQNRDRFANAPGAGPDAACASNSRACLCGPARRPRTPREERGSRKINGLAQLGLVGRAHCTLPWSTHSLEASQGTAKLPRVPVVASLTRCRITCADSLTNQSMSNRTISGVCGP